MGGGAEVPWGVASERGGFNPPGAVDAGGGEGGRERGAGVKGGVECLVVVPLCLELLLQCLQGVWF